MRLSIALLTALTSTAASTPALACCLTDRLFGRNAYVVGYAPVATAPYAVGYAPAAAVAAPVQSTSVLPPTSTQAPVANNGVYQAQRPAYYDNPSVYTGQPISSVQSYRVPMTTAQPVGPVTTIPPGTQPQVVGTPPAYASNYAAAQAPSTSPGLPIQVTTPTGTPATAIPATQVAPVFVPAQPQVGGLGRFFGSLYGTNYRSSYYRAPITYYRPVTTIDPVTGTTVTVQRPCTSSVQQLQRVPYTSLQLAHPAPAKPNPSTCSPSASCQSSPSMGAYAPYTQIAPATPTAPASGIGQVGALGAPAQGTMQIPSTAPITGSGAFTPQTAPPTMAPPTMAPPTMAPLTGAPRASIQPAPQGSLQPMSPGSPQPVPQGPSSAGSGDLSPVDQPQLNGSAAPPTESSLKPESNGEPPRSYWQLQKAEDSTAMIRGSSRSSTDRDPVSLGTVNSTSASPIEAPSDYVAPFGRRSIGSPPSSPPQQQPLQPPPLPTQSYDASDMTSVSNRVSVPVREAALTRTSAPQQRLTPKPVKRDTTWLPIEP